MGRHQIPVAEKTCGYCGKPLMRRRFNGRLEDRGAFSRRKFCDFTCMASSFIGRDRGGRSNTRMRTEARLLVPEGPCEKCCVKPGVHVHHMDGNPQNNERNNLQRLCAKCHRQAHAKHHRCLLCGLPHKALGYCNKHYLRFKRTGSPFLESDKK